MNSSDMTGMVTVRNNALTNNFDIEIIRDQNWTKTRRWWPLFTDPICTIALRRALLAKEHTSRLAPNEHTILLKLENLINGVLFLFNEIVGNSSNSILSYMRPFFTGSDYPDTFTSNDIIYCNIMYWMLLPAMGAKVYRVQNSAQVHAVQYDQLQQGEGLYRLENELNLMFDEAPTQPRMIGVCFFTKTAQAAVGYDDVTAEFPPTAGFSVDNNATFHPTSVVTYMWAARIRRLTGVTNCLAKLLLGLHYSTLMTRKVILEHYDTKYYSGLSYLMFRGLRFTGCGIAIMPQKSALYTLGTGIICKPTSLNTHQLLTVNQYCESVIIPETMSSPGLYMSNMYMKDLRGGDVNLNSGSPFDMVVADAFNGFCPESDTSCGTRRPYIFTTGRSERLDSAISRDPLMKTDGYTCMPTLLRPFSSVMALKNKNFTRGRTTEESNAKLFCKTQHVVDLDKGVLSAVSDPFKDTIERTNGNKRITDIMHKELGVAFCGTYGVGLTSYKKLKCFSYETNDSLVDRLAPRISGTGLFASTPIHASYQLITPIFNRVYENARFSRTLDH